MTVIRPWHASKFLLRSATAASLLSAAVLMASTLPASAASTARFWNGSGVTEGWSCAGSGGHFDMLGLITADNGCATRVWLKGNGYSWCISPGVYESVPTKYDNPQTIGISANTAKC